MARLACATPPLSSPSPLPLSYYPPSPTSHSPTLPNHPLPHPSSLKCTQADRSTHTHTSIKTHPSPTPHTDKQPHSHTHAHAPRGQFLNSSSRADAACAGDRVEECRSGWLLKGRRWSPFLREEPGPLREVVLWGLLAPLRDGCVWVLSFIIVIQFFFSVLLLCSRTFTLDLCL